MKAFDVSTFFQSVIETQLPEMKEISYDLEDNSHMLKTMAWEDKRSLSFDHVGKP